MELYLQSVSPDDFMEINQAVPLSGIYTAPFDFTAGELNVKDTLQSLLEVMDDTQKLYVHSVSAGFRSILDEGKTLHALSDKIVLVVPADAQGLMALKACRTLKIPAAAANVYDPAQILVASKVTEAPVIADLDAISRHGDARQVLSQAAAILDDPGKQLMVSGCMNQEAFTGAAMVHPAAIAARPEVFRSMMYSVLTQSEMENARDQWIMTYTSDTVLD